MKKNIFKKLVGLVTLACVMSVFFVLPLQAATPTPVTPVPTQTRAVKITLTDLIHPMDIPVDWTENIAMRTYTSQNFIVAVQSQIAAALQKAYLGPINAYTIPATAIVTAWYMLENQNTYMIIHYYWTPSHDIYSPYYIKKHIDYYTNSARTNKISESETFYYSTVNF